MTNFFLVLVTLVALMWATPLRAYFRGLPWPHALVTFGFCYVILVGQFLGESRQTYPFTQWNMYCRREAQAPAKWLEIIGRTTTGETVRLDVNALQPALGHLRLRMRLNDLLLKEELQQPKVADDWLRVLAAWQEQASGQEFTQVTVERMEWTSAEEKPSRQLVRQIEVAP